MPRGKKRATVKTTETPIAPKKDSVRVELMKRIYVSKDPESTPETWLHHPDCPPKTPKCADFGCRAVSGLEVGSAIDAGWWNDVPGDE